MEVFARGGSPPAMNVASGKSATQSSTFPGLGIGGAALAVDNNTDGNFFDGSVTATNLDPEPLVAGGFGIFGSRRFDRHLEPHGLLRRPLERLLGIRFGYAVPGDRHARHAAKPRGNVRQPIRRSRPIHPPRSRLPPKADMCGCSSRARAIWSLAEVQVFGTGVPATSNPSQGKAAAQSSTFSGLCHGWGRIGRGWQHGWEFLRRLCYGHEPGSESLVASGI